MSNQESDRELLDLAAKAAGIPAYELVDTTGDNGGIETEGWNPLMNDGDALRLAMALTMQLDCNAELPGVSLPVAEYVAANGDANAALRRAIVRAAAEIGKAT